jgi:hypothetical protein
MSRKHPYDHYPKPSKLHPLCSFINKTSGRNPVSTCTPSILCTNMQSDSITGCVQTFMADYIQGMQKINTVSHRSQAWNRIWHQFQIILYYS